MKLKVTWEKFLDKLERRPALIKVLVGLTDGQVKRCLKRSLKSFSFLAEGYKTLGVCRYALESGGYNQIYREIPREILRAMPEGVRAEVLESDPRAVISLGITDKALWLRALGEGQRFDYEEIPSELVGDDDIVAKWLSSNRYREIPGERWTGTLVDKVLELDINFYNKIPERYRTLAWLNRALDSGEVNVDSIPEGWWSEELAMKCSTLANYWLVPSKYVTSEWVMALVGRSGISRQVIDVVPAGLRSREFYVSYLVHAYSVGRDSIPGGLLNDPTFQLEVVGMPDRELGKGHIASVLKAGGVVTEETWLKVLAIHPASIQLIAKSLQTKGQVAVVVRGASSGVLSSVVGYLNRNHITAELLPLLVGVSGFEEIVEKKFRGRSRGVIPDGDVGGVTVEMSPSEYKRLFGGVMV